MDEKMDWLPSPYWEYMSYTPTPAIPLASKSSLEKAPFEIKSHIFKYLMKGDYVRLPFDDTPRKGTNYRFHLSILQTSRRLYLDARYFLYQHNSFAIVSCDVCRITNEDLETHEVGIVSRNHEHVLSFQYASLLMCIKCRHSTYSNDAIRNSSCFLMLSTDFDSFSRCIKDIDLVHHITCPRHHNPADNTRPFLRLASYFPTFKFCFLRVLGEPPTKKVQKSFLDPFLQFRECGHTIEAKGSLDDEYQLENLARDGEQAMTRVCWFRAMPFELFDMVLAIKEKADDAFLHGSTHLAFTRYLSCLRLIKRKPKIPYHHQLFFSCHANATLPFLKLFLEKDFNVNPHNQLSMMSFYFLEHESYYDQYLHPDEVTTLYILYGLAHGALGSLRRAQIFITKVCLRDLNCFTVTFLQKFVTDGRRTKNNMMGICESLLGYYIPKYPFALGVLTPMVCKTIAVERIMLSQLNYRGDLLETRLVAPDNSIIMSKRELQMFVDMFKESLKTLYSEFRKQNSATSISRVGYSLFVYGER